MIQQTRLKKHSNYQKTCAQNNQHTVSGQKWSDSFLSLDLFQCLYTHSSICQPRKVKSRPSAHEKQVQLNK